jgi:hypothetical protein
MIYLSWDFFEETEEIHEKCQPGYATSLPNFEKDTELYVACVRKIRSMI